MEMQKKYRVKVKIMCKAYSKPKNRPDVPTIRKHVRQKMPVCLAIV